MIMCLFLFFQAQTAPISPNYEVHAGGMRSPRGQADRTDNPAEPYHIQSWGTDGNHLASWGIEAPAPQTNKVREPNMEDCA